MSKSIGLLKKTTAVTLAVLVAVTTLFSFSLTADAAKKYVKSVKVAKKSVSLKKGKSTTVKVTVKVSGKASKKFTVKSSKKSVAAAKVKGSKVQITAKKEGKATVTVTTKAKGKKGKKLSAKIKVTVKKAELNIASESSEYNPLLISAGASASLFDLDPVFSQYEDKIQKDTAMFASSDDSFVTVNSYGVVTGVKKTSIPVGIKVVIQDVNGKIHQFYSYVAVADGSDVPVTQPATQPATQPVTQAPATQPETQPATQAPVSNDIGIASFGATSAKILTVRLTRSLTNDEKTKLEFTIKKGSSKLTLSKEWADASTVNFTAGSDLEATNYTASISSGSLSIDSSKSSASCSVSKNGIKEVKIVTKRIACVNNVKVYFDAIDNYGNKITGTKASDFNWQLSCADAQVKTSMITIDSTNKDYIVLTNFANDSIGIKADSTVLGVQAILKTDASVKSGSKDVEVRSLTIASVTIEGIALTDVTTRVYTETMDKTYKLAYTAVDQFGDPIDWSMYHPGSPNSAYNNEFNAYSDNTDLVSAPTVTDGELTITVKKNMTGKAHIYAVVGAGSYTPLQIEVLASAAPKTINFPDSSEYSVVAGEDTTIKVPVTFTDQYGYTMVKGSVSNSKFNSTFTSIIKSDNNLIVGYDSSIEGDFVTFNAKNLSYSSTQQVNVAFGTYIDSNLELSTFIIKVDPERAPASLKFTNGGVPESLLVGEEAVVEYQVMDNRSAEWHSNSNLNVVVDIADTTYLTTSYSSVASNGTGKITLKGKMDSTGNYNPATQIKVRLVYKSNTIAESSYNVVVYPNLSEIKMNASPATANAGQLVTLTLTAYKNSTTKLDGYNRKYSDIVFTQTDASDSSRTSTEFKDVEFVNGVATVQVTAKVAAESVKFTTKITATGGSTFNITAAETVKINAGSAQSYNITAKNKTILSKTVTMITLTAVDQYTNTVTGYSPSGSTYMTLKDKNGNSLNPTDYFSSSTVDSNGKVILTFTDGVASFVTAADKPLPTGAVITVTSGTISGSATRS